MTSTLPASNTSTAIAAFGAAFEQAISLRTHDDMLRAWDAARTAWLRNRKNANTRGGYATALNQFWMFVGVDPWLIEAQHRAAYARALASGVMVHADDLPPGQSVTPRLHQVQPWQVSPNHVNDFGHWLGTLGKSDATIGHRLAACSSFYDHVIRDVRMDDTGVEHTIYFDRTGRTRANPFKSGNVERPEITPFGNARPVPLELITAMMLSINTSTPTGARAFALLETLIQTGWRNEEVRRLRWSDLRPNPHHRGEYIAAWAGKGGKSQEEAFPRKAFDAIVNYLKTAGRWPVLEPDSHIFERLQNGHAAGFGIEAKKPYISGGQANAVLRGALVRGMVKRLGYSQEAAQAEARKHHVHGLRHASAQRYMEEFNDAYGLQKRLHHANFNTTRIYAESGAVQRVKPAQQLDFGY